MSAFVAITDAHLRVADVSHMRWDRGHSFTHLLITMRDGTLYTVKDWQGSAYAAERAILEASQEPRP